MTWYGGKFSTSEKRGVFMDAALELLPSDLWRWHLMANAPETADAPFTLARVRIDRGDGAAGLARKLAGLGAARQPR